MLDSTSMKAVRLVRLGKSLEDAEVSLPDIGASEVLVRVAACGICHSDAHYRAGISPIDSLPVTLGHEVGACGNCGARRPPPFTEIPRLCALSGQLRLLRLLPP